MKTYAGDLFLELPESWDDDSNYVYRRPLHDIEVRVERSPVTPAFTPDNRIDVIQERLKLLGPLEDPKREAVQVAGRQGMTLSARSKREGDKEASLMEVLVFRANDKQAITITALAPEKKRSELAAAWRSILAKTRLVEP